VHPGYGFLAENADFAERCVKEGLAFIGPRPETIRLMGDKSAARKTAVALGIPVVPGSSEAFSEVEEARSAAAALGFPLLLKARAGGGGRGMRIVADAEAFDGLYMQAAREASAAFGDGAIYLERYLSKARHIEVQVFGDSQGNLRHLWERDCSLQRRHQKLIEEACSPVLDDDTRARLCATAEALGRGTGYLGAGTVEFLYDGESGQFYFIEMNTRIQVEHPVTEMLTGVDLVAEQLRIAAGEPISFANGQTPGPLGHVIEFRINAEDPDKDFLPAPGRLRRWRPPSGEGLRLDSHAYEGYMVPPYYDSLIGKLIVQGRDRPEAIARAEVALSGFEVEGVATTIPFHLRVLRHPDFIESRIHTRWIEDHSAKGAGHA
jgi:acetyl-CoA carboxylase biotin carboxylase subunit